MSEGNAHMCISSILIHCGPRPCPMTTCLHLQYAASQPCAPMPHAFKCLPYTRAAQLCYFGEGKRTQLGRGYGRVSRRKMRAHLLKVG